MKSLTEYVLPSGNTTKRFLRKCVVVSFRRPTEFWEVMRNTRTEKVKSNTSRLLSIIFWGQKLYWPQLSYQSCNICKFQRYIRPSDRINNICTIHTKYANFYRPLYYSTFKRKCTFEEKSNKFQIHFPYLLYQWEYYEGVFNNWYGIWHV